MRQDDFDDWRIRLDQLDEYVARVRQAQKEFPSLVIKLAMEVDYLPGHQEWIRELAGRYPWDYFIGSVHYVADGFAIDNPKLLGKWRERDPFEIWSIYFDWLGQAAESGLFEIIGHADLPKKFKIYPKEDCTPLYERFLERAAKANVCIELNTAGLRKDCREIYPARALLEIAAAKKVPITFGSDAHAASEVGYEFTAAMDLARSVGYTHSCRFTQRQRTSAPF
jgi:histidinol-phosphatase (PHP family)